jgi:hypothetical protein
VSRKDIWAPRIVWGPEHVEISAVQAMEAENNGGAARNPRDEAKKLLRRLLANGPVIQKDIQEEADASDIFLGNAQTGQEGFGGQIGQERHGWLAMVLPGAKTEWAFEQ